jgi:hypothetical protein
MKKLLLALCYTAALIAPVAHAGSDHGHGGHDHGPKHGGVVHEVGDIAGELVIKADTMTLYLFDHDKPLATADSKSKMEAVATVHAGGAKTTVTLTPAGDNKLAATGSFKTGVGVRVAVVVKRPGNPEIKLNFRLK